MLTRQLTVGSRAMLKFYRDRPVEDEEVDPSGFSSFQAALGFCALGVLGALVLAPLADKGAQHIGVLASSQDGIDRTVTGAVEPAKPDEVRRYTIRRSVLQRDPSQDCIIYEDGTEEGGC